VERQLMSETTSTITITHRWTGAVIWSGPATSLRLAVQAAVARDANLGDANLGGANLGGANLRDANLGGADLRDADLGDADLRDADLRDADLGGANLGGANLRDANLGGADLRDADLRDADLGGANLGDANLGDANLTPIRDDLWAVLSTVPADVPALLAALEAGRVDGSTYQGDCACLVGTIAKARACDYDAIPGLEPDAGRPIERFFAGIRPGDTPATSQFAQLAHQWATEWLVRMRTAFGAAMGHGMACAHAHRVRGGHGGVMDARG
jgi:Pentapeptide repeats (8 copies)